MPYFLQCSTDFDKTRRTRSRGNAVGNCGFIRGLPFSAFYRALIDHIAFPLPGFTKEVKTSGKSTNQLLLSRKCIGNWQHTVSTGRATRPTARWVRGSKWRYVLWKPPQGLSLLPTRLRHHATRRHMRIPPPPIFHTLTQFMSSDPRLAQDVSLFSKGSRLALRPPASYSMGTGFPNLGESSRFIRLTTHLHKTPRL